MSKFYNPKRTRNLYDPDARAPFKLSRSKIDLFLNCPRCFYLDRRCGVSQPPGLPFALNSAVDTLLKKEFDSHRAHGTSHPLMKSYGIDAIPLKHERINEWRDALGGGISFLDPNTNFFVTGGVDDVWVSPKDELMIVDYKSTSKNSEVNLDADWQIGYKRQMEIYQWLFRKNDFNVSDTGYFVYCNGKTDKQAFDGKLEFDVKILPYIGNDTWIEETLISAKKCLDSVVLPESTENCDYCAYRKAARDFEK